MVDLGFAVDEGSKNTIRVSQQDTNRVDSEV